ncbi:MAG: hypothetical protein JXR89_08315 [Deltaproteobacteria bacterium]|nr:hypothetical protein [Deltaproteobacteria bacterium]
MVDSSSMRLFFFYRACQETGAPRHDCRICKHREFDCFILQNEYNNFDLSQQDGNVFVGRLNWGIILIFSPDRAGVRPTGRGKIIGGTNVLRKKEKR